jgi:putative ABC transport system ATP-binding protein
MKVKTMTDTAIKTENLVKSYGTVEVIRGVSIEVPKAQFSAIVGKSGSGKSTLLGLISGLEAPDTGRVLLNGTDLFALDDTGLAEARRCQIGIVFQSFNLVPSLSALENVLLPVVFDDKMSKADYEARGHELLGQVGMETRASHRPGALSGGEQQRVAIARALINQPAILLADEPTGNLDEITAAGVFDLLTGLCRDIGTTLLMVTHDMDIAAKADRIIEIKNGKVDQ